MTADPDDKTLDQLLQGWSRQREVAPSPLRDLHDRIVRAAVDERLVAGESNGTLADTTRTEPATGHDVCVTRDGRSAEGEPTRAWTWLGRLALALLVSIVGTWLVRKAGPPARVMPAPQGATSVVSLPPSLAKLPVDQLQLKSRLLRELEGVYERRIEWFAETNDHLEIDDAAARDGAPVASPAEPPIVIRVVVQKRSLESAQWQLAWAIDVVARNEQLVRVPTPSSAVTDLELWVFRLPDGAIHVESHVTLPGQDRVQADSAAVLVDGRPTQVYQRLTDRAEYRVIQLAAALPTDVG